MSVNSTTNAAKPARPAVIAADFWSALPVRRETCAQTQPATPAPKNKDTNTGDIPSFYYDSTLARARTLIFLLFLPGPGGLALRSCQGDTRILRVYQKGTP